MTTALHPLPHAPRAFPTFSLSRLLRTVFQPEEGERICVLIDLPEPREMLDFAFLERAELTIQRHAYNDFYLPLRDGILYELGLKGGEMFAFEATGGSNLDLPEEARNCEGRALHLVDDVLRHYDIVLCISTYSATAPLTALAKEIGFRGATLHGVNDIILRSGLAVDYREVSVAAEKLRLGLTRADWAEIDYAHDGRQYTLRLELGRQEAQKSHGLCRPGEPDVANLPAGEIYFVPVSAEGEFPMRYEDGTIGLMRVSGGRVQEATLLSGDPAIVQEHNAKLQSDPVTGELGELGFGTQELPVSGRDIQDEKILGTLHVATGRSDHLGGPLTPDRFAHKKHATHDDILFSPSKTPEIDIPQVRLHRDGKTEVLIEHFEPAAYMRELLAQ